MTFGAALLVIAAVVTVATAPGRLVELGRKLDAALPSVAGVGRRLAATHLARGDRAPTAFPANGTTEWSALVAAAAAAAYNGGAAPLGRLVVHAESPPGVPAARHVVSVRDWATDLELARAYLHAGAEHALSLPRGRYRIVAAWGDAAAWRSPERLFGPLTSAIRTKVPVEVGWEADDALMSPGAEVVRHVWLPGGPNGNVPSEPVGPRSLSPPSATPASN